MVLIFGTICLDRVRRVPRMPAPGGYVEIVAEEFLLGGEAANTANALRVWGADFVLAGNGLGEGASGEALQKALQEHRLEPMGSHLLAPGRTPVCDVYVADDGERTMIGQGFSAMESTVDASKLPFQRGNWFTAEPNMAKKAREATRLAHENGMNIYTMDFVEESDPIFPASFWQSSTDWVGKRGNARANMAWLKGWIERHGCFSILTDGPNGFIAGSPELAPRVYPPYPATEIVDATGSGDMFRAGMLFGLENDWPISRCLQFASAAGCLGCQALGATTYVPSRDEVEALIAENPETSKRYD